MKKDNSQDKIISFPEKKSDSIKKSSNYKYIGYAVLFAVMIAVAFFAGSDSSFNTTNYVNTDIITLTDANNYAFSAYKEGYVLAKDGRISCFNTNQELQWEINGSKTIPQIKVNEKYVLVYYNEDKLAIVTNGSKTTRIKTTGNVIYGYVNNNGYTVLLLKEAGLKNKITVYNKKGDMLYYRDNPDKFISYAVLSDDNTSLVTSELITNENDISSELIVTNIRNNENVSSIKFQNAIPGGCILTKKKEIITLFETKMQCYGISSGKLKWETGFGGKSLYKYTYDNSLLGFIFNKDDSANTGSEIAFYNKNGKRVGGFETKTKAQGIDLCDKTALLTLDRKLEVINTKGKHLSSADLTYDMKEVVFMANKKCALILSNSREAKLLPFE